MQSSPLCMQASASATISNMNMPSHANTTASHSRNAWRCAAAVLTAAAVLPTAAAAAQLRGASAAEPHTLGGLTGPHRTLACVRSPLDVVYCYGDEKPPSSPPPRSPTPPLPDDYELVAECTAVATTEAVERSDCGSVHADAGAPSPPPRTYTWTPQKGAVGGTCAHRRRLQQCVPPLRHPRQPAGGCHRVGRGALANAPGVAAGHAAPVSDRAGLPWSGL